MPWTIKRPALPIMLLASAGSAAFGHAMPAPIQVTAAAEAPPPDLPQGDGPRATSAAQSSRYDDVGYAGVDGQTRGDAITASQAALPPGSFAEVTDLDNGKTILLQIAGSGPGSSGSADRALEQRGTAARRQRWRPHSGAGAAGGSGACRPGRTDAGTIGCDAARFATDPARGIARALARGSADSAAKCACDRRHADGAPAAYPPPPPRDAGKGAARGEKARRRAKGVTGDWVGFSSR